MRCPATSTTAKLTCMASQKTTESDGDAIHYGKSMRDEMGICPGERADCTDKPAQARFTPSQGQSISI